MRQAILHNDVYAPCVKVGSDLRGRRATCCASVADELKQAGALPADLPAFMRETMKLL